MKAAFLIEPGKMEVRITAQPEPGPGEVRIKLAKVGICGSDVHLFGGHRPLTYPFIIGHEGVGYVDAVGKGVKKLKEDDLVAVEPNIPCGKCRFCTSGRGNICPEKRVIGLNVPGCFAEYVVLPEAFAWKISESIDINDAVLVEPTAVALHALKTASLSKGNRIAVLGLGAIGMLIVYLAKLFGYKVLATDLNSGKVDIAVRLGAEALGAPPHHKDGFPEYKARLEAADVAAIFDCAGSSEATTMILGCAPRGSEIILVGLSEKLASFSPLQIVREGNTIKSSIIYDHPVDFRETIHMMESGVIAPGTLISGFESFDHIQQGMERAAKGNDVKVVVEF